ncbi:YflT domain-containing protein [Cohnella rhizosphaerae]|uniref:General stress protein n=1 Tax=Cohnella rhizosphaerae TaxID=1457232 RepID=A0A9X4L020_9BACL|nr:general stress protein [Cohnella rhizosphaerae]MDG0814082.1 general stress protein [Cohnella rhizosphaerae]
MHTPVVGTFRNEQDVIGAIEALKAAGWNKDDISVVSHKREAVHRVDTVTGTNSAEGMVTGGVAGAFLGGTAGLLATAGLLFIPGLGPLLAAGPIATVIAGAAVGGSTGTLIGGLVGLGIPDREAEIYKTLVEQDHLLVIVKANAEDRAHAERIFQTFGAVGPRSTAVSYVQSPLPAAAAHEPADEMRVYINAKDGDVQTPVKELVIPHDSREV